MPPFAASVVLRGPPGVGKSTTAARLVEQLPYASRLDLDAFWGSVSDRRWDSATLPAAITDVGSAAWTAKRRGDVYVVVDGNTLGHFTDRLLAALPGPVVLVNLMANDDVLVARMNGRPSGFQHAGGAIWTARQIEREDQGAFIDTSGMGRSGTVIAVRKLLPPPKATAASLRRLRCVPAATRRVRA